MVSNSTMSDVKSDTTDCTDGRSCLLEAVDGLTAAEFDIPNVVGEWSVRQCLAHLVGWDAWVLNAFDRCAAGLPLGPLPTEREINDAAPGDWADRPVTHLLRTLHSTRDELAERAGRMTDEERERPWIQMGEHEIAVNDLLDSLIDHDLEHAAQIRTWRKTRVA